jgi:hypothetical protein
VTAQGVVSQTKDGRLWNRGRGTLNESRAYWLLDENSGQLCYQTKCPTLFPTRAQTAVQCSDQGKYHVGLAATTAAPWLASVQSACPSNGPYHKSSLTRAVSLLSRSTVRNQLPAYQLPATRGDTVRCRYVGPEKQHPQNAAQRSVAASTSVIRALYRVACSMSGPRSPPTAQAEVRARV